MLKKIINHVFLKEFSEYKIFKATLRMTNHFLITIKYATKLEIFLNILLNKKILCQK